MKRPGLQNQATKPDATPARRHASKSPSIYGTEIKRSYCNAGIFRFSIAALPVSESGSVMTLSTFKCERCHGFKQTLARRKGVLEHTLLPLMFIGPIRCEECGDRYKTF